MRIAFMGKGGSGKTTLTAAFTKYSARHHDHVLVIDGDVNVHLGQTLRMPTQPASTQESEIFSYFEGHRNLPVIGKTPPTRDSQFVRVHRDDPFLKKYATQNDTISLYTVGTYEASDIGHSCYHGKLGVAEILFHHLLDTENDLVVSDFTAGIDSLGTSLFFVSDMNIFVVEPTQKGVQVYLDFLEKSQPESVQTFVVVNKVNSPGDLEFVKSKLGEDVVLGAVEYSPQLTTFEQGNEQAFDTFVSQNEALLKTIGQKAKEQKRDWKAYYRRLVEIYQLNCEQWYNNYYAQKLDDKVDADFSYQEMLAKYA